MNTPYTLEDLRKMSHEDFGRACHKPIDYNFRLRVTVEILYNAEPVEDTRDEIITPRCSMDFANHLKERILKIAYS